MKRGKCGKNLTWRLYDTGTFTINGKGAMYDYDSQYETIPWASYRYEIEKVIIRSGATSICNNAFEWCSNLKEITIPRSIKSIGDWAFAGCTSLEEIKIPASVKTIGYFVFSGCTSLEKIYYKAGADFENDLQDGNNAELIPSKRTPSAKSISSINWTPSPVVIPSSHLVTQPKPPVTTTTPKFVQPAQLTPVQKKFHFGNSLTAQPVAEKLTWSFAGKTLTVGGVREIKFFPYAQIPWLKHLHDIQRIVVGDGVEKIAAHAFEECTRLEMVTLPASVKTIGDMFASVAFCGNRFVNGGRNVFWCLEDGVLVLKKNPDAQGDDFSTGDISWIFAEKNIRGIKLEDGVKPTEKFYSWLTQRFDGKEISFR